MEVAPLLLPAQRGVSFSAAGQNTLQGLKTNKTKTNKQYQTPTFDLIEAMKGETFTKWMESCRNLALQINWSSDCPLV